MPSKAPAQLLQECPSCAIQPDYPGLVLSNGTVNIIGFNITNVRVHDYASYIHNLYRLSYPGFSTLGVEFTAYNYTAYSTFTNARIADTTFADEITCISVSTRVSLATPIFIPSPGYYQAGFFQVAATPFVRSLNPDCLSSGFVPFISSTLTNVLSTVILSRSSPPNTLSTSSSHISTASMIPTAPPPLISVNDPHQSPSVGLTESKHLTIGLVVGIVVPIILITLGLSSFCLVRRRRKRKEKAAVSAQDVKEDQGDHTQMYFQQKVELDDEQRRHEMEAAELRYEMEGEDTTQELPGEEAHGRNNRQELRGEEHAKELETSQGSAPLHGARKSS